MKKSIIFLLILGLLGVIAYAAGQTNATNLYTAEKAGYTTSGTTITFPAGSQAIEVVNFESSNVLEVTYQGQTLEVDPAVSPTVSLSDCDFKSVILSAKSGTVSAEVRVLF